MFGALLASASASDYVRSFDGGAIAVDTTLSSAGTVYEPNATELVVSSGADLRHAILVFTDLVGDGTDQLPEGSLVRAATLSFAATVSSGDPEAIEAWSLAEAWYEVDATWKIRLDSLEWASEGAGEASRGQACGSVASAAGTLDVDTTACVATWAAGGVNYGWVLAPSTDGRPGEIAITLGSVESASRPLLTVDFTAPDRDGDGSDLWLDCDDADGTVHPGAPDDDGDGVDDDCDGTPDDDLGDTADSGSTADLDGDRFGSEEGDCDDGDAEVHPGRDDGCDGIDSDCDGRIDEDCGRPAVGSGCGCGDASSAWVLLAGLLRWRGRPGSSGPARHSRRAPS